MKKLTYSLIILMLILTQTVFSQEELSDANTNFDDENYEVALKQYLKFYKKNANDPQINYKIGICYLKTNFDKKSALTYLLKADSLKPNYFPSITFDLAQAYFHALNFTKAQEYAQNYTQNKKLKPEELAVVDKFFETIENAKKLTSKPINVTFINLGKTLNSPQDDYIPFITEDENFMVFTSARKYLSDYQQFIKGVYFSKKSNGIWSAATAASSKINSDENEEVVGISKDGNTLLVHVDRLSNPHDIFYSEKNKSGNYGELKDFGPNINSKSSEMGASLTITGDTLYFASNRPGGMGGFDIYMSVRRPDGTWSPATNLGEPINTADDENYPYITADGQYLYFSCNGRNSMGGYDIYKSKLADGKWSEPINLGYPINDTYDNYNIALTSNTRYGYVSKCDNNSIGGLDIYRIIFNDVPPTNIAFTGNILVGDSIKNVPFKQVDSLITISVINKTNPSQTYSYQPSKKGKYTIALTPGYWELEISGNAYETYKKEFIIRDEQPTQTVYFQNIYLKKKIKK
ncbi:MAG: PD40 domain-containing protein [Bacteroidales bacterium]|nr:PD40 domain-containing protein [Bacteroidales bacterium]